MTYSTIVTALLLLITLPSCFPTDKTEQTLQHYDLAKPEKFFMPESLLEISGISFHKKNSDTIYAIQDEEGKVFRLAWNKKNNTTQSLAKKETMKTWQLFTRKLLFSKVTVCCLHFLLKKPFMKNWTA